MKNIFLFLISTFMFITISAQENMNMDLLSNVQFNENSSDIWGFVDSNGIEYAVIGTASNTRIFSLEDPSNPIERAVIAGATSIWRDIKSWKNHIYVTTDQGADGLLIIDMTAAPNAITHSFWKPSLTVGASTGTLRTCHNLYIDEKGYAYLAGTNISNRGVIIIDVDTDPNNPIYKGAADFTYAHDAFARGDTLYASEINIGEFSIYDISEPSQPVYLGGAETSMNFTHNAWLSDDGNTLFTTDERGNAYVDSYDISDLGNIQRLDTYQPLETQNQGVIPHNTHYINGYLVTSWYTDGVVVTDVSDPSNIIKVASYDTWSGGNGGFNGCWGAYPFLPSGLILASDIQSGLYIFQANYLRAARLEGIVTDEDTGEAINDVTVEIIDVQANQTTTDPSGNYKTGIVSTGLKSIRFTHAQYATKTFDGVNFNNGNLIIQNAQLKRKQSVQISINTVSADSGNPLGDCEIYLTSEQGIVELSSDENGISAATIVADNYDIYVGKWGYLHAAKLNQDLFNNPQVTIALEKGYQDDFIFDLRWQTSGTSPTGRWTRDIPNPTQFTSGNSTVFSNVNEDIQNDIGSQCYLTGNADGSVGADDVDGGNVILTSPSMDLSDYENPRLEYNLWFFNDGGQGSIPNDQLRVSISNGEQTVLLEEIDMSTDGWKERSIIFLDDIIDVSSSMNIIVETYDDNPGHLVEAGFDALLVQDGLVNATEVESVDFTLGPNPFHDQLNIIIDHPNAVRIDILDNRGRLLKSQVADQIDNIVSLTSGTSGLYIIQIIDLKGNVIASKKAIKAK